MASKLSEGIVQQGYLLAAPTDSNQVFPLLPDKVIAHLSDAFSFHPWQPGENNQSVIRLVTSWATDVKQVDALLERMPNAKA